MRSCERAKCNKSIAKLRSTSLFSRQCTMYRNVPCWELRMMKRTWKKRFDWYRPRIHVQPSMTNCATILKIINLKNKEHNIFFNIICVYTQLSREKLSLFSVFHLISAHLSKAILHLNITMSSTIKTCT